MPKKIFRHTLTVHTGPMKSAKTLNLIQAFVGAQVGKRSIQAFRMAKKLGEEPTICTRFGNVCVPATLVKSSREMLKAFRPETKLVLIDEAQFFDKNLPKIVETMLFQADVCVAGLDLDFLAQPFGTMPQLMAMADTVNKYLAICDVCGAPAHLSQRLTNGKPSKPHEPEVVPEGTQSNVTYEARCRNCYKETRT